MESTYTNYLCSFRHPLLIEFTSGNNLIKYGQIWTIPQRRRWGTRRTTWYLTVCLMANNVLQSNRFITLCKQKQYSINENNKENTASLQNKNHAIFICSNFTHFLHHEFGNCFVYNNHWNDDESLTVHKSGSIYGMKISLLNAFIIHKIILCMKYVSLNDPLVVICGMKHLSSHIHC